MIKPSTLNLDILPVDHRRRVAEKLQGAVITITDSEIKGFRDGKEVDLDVYEPVFRFGNNSGTYAVGEVPTESSDQDQASEGMSAAIRDIWAKRRMAGRLSAGASNDRLSVRDIYASRRGQVSA